MSSFFMNRPAGRFGDWLASMRAVLGGQQDADVPCGDCTGCCVSSYPIPLRPSDRVALERVPGRYLQLPAAGSDGLARMGFDQDGCCPMLESGSCSIYADRPRTCRDYDCRIYAAAGLEPDGERPVIQQRVREWQFAMDGEPDHDKAAAVRRAAQFIREHHALFPAAVRAGSATAVAVLAVKVYPLFGSDREAGQASRDELVRETLALAAKFDRETQVRR